MVNGGRASGQGTLALWIVGAALTLVPGSAAAEPSSAATPVVSVQLRAADRHAALGDEYYRRHRVRDAIAEWRLALELDPGRAGLVRRIEAAEQGRDPEAAAAALDPARERALRLAELDYRHSRVREAEAAWQETLRLYPDDPAARTGLRRLSEEHFRSDPEHPYDQLTRTLYQDGLAAYRLADWIGAEAKLAEAQKLAPAHPQVADFLGRTRERLARQRDQDHARDLTDRAQEAERSGDWARAHRAWREALRLEPPAPGAADGLSRTTRALEVLTTAHLAEARQAEAEARTVEALDAYARVLEMEPDQAIALAGIERLRAREAARNAETKARRTAQDRYQDGVAAYRKGDLDTAARELTAAAAAQPRDAALQAEAARVQRLAAAAAEQAGRKASARYADGLAAYQRGDLDAARAAWRETLELDPGHGKARANLRRLEQELR